MRRPFLINIALVLTIPIALSISGCHRGASTSDDETPDNSAYRPLATPATQFERDMKYVRDGHFAHVWIFSRKDGKELTKEDSDVLRTNAPKVVDWVRPIRTASSPGQTLIWNLRRWRRCKKDLRLRIIRESEFLFGVPPSGGY